MTITVKFNDHKRKATEPADPRYPNGVDASVVKDKSKPYCGFGLPYPAPGCGTYSVVCDTCKFTALVTVAGRADDPRSIALPCKQIKTVLHS